MTPAGLSHRVGTLLALLALLAAAFAPRVARGEQAGMDRPPTEQPGSRVVQPEAVPAPLMPAQFVVEALSGGRAEVAMAQLAISWAGSPAVRDHAMRVVADRSWLNARLESLAHDRNLRLPDGLDAQDRARLETLLTERGAEFDRAYLEAMITAHRRDATLYEVAAAAGFPDDELRRLASETLPYLRAHLERATALQDRWRVRARCRPGRSLH
jgi:putative membrane protein